MTINIRRNVFETNSSSSHSISLTFREEGDLDDTLPVNEHGEIVITGEDFTGIEFMISGARSKAALIAAYIMVYDDQKLKERFESALKKHTGASKISYDMRFVKQEGIPANTFYCPDIEDTYWYNDNEDELDFSTILKSKKRIIQFIFNKDTNIEAGEIYC